MSYHGRRYGAPQTRLEAVAEVFGLIEACGSEAELALGYGLAAALEEGERHGGEPQCDFPLDPEQRTSRITEEDLAVWRN